MKHQLDATLCRFYFCDAKQARDIHNYKNIKRKPYRTNAAIWYNKICRQKQLTPAYINIRMKGKNQQCQNTLRTANLYRINQEIKFLYAKKSKLNEKLLQLHLKCADDWNNVWSIIIKAIEDKLTNEMESHYNHLHKKLDKLQKEKPKKEGKYATKEPTIPLPRQDSQSNKHKIHTRRNEPAQQWTTI
jgi:hypothetical protein